jgi:hypothetical protein
MLAGGFFYWLAFLLVLEPGNIFLAAGRGGLDVGHETLRMTGAAVIGALTTPLLIALVRRYPVAGARRWTNFARLAASDVILACGLVIIACLLARPVLHDDPRPIAVALRHELLSNGPLVGFSIAAFLTLAHLLGGPSGLEEAPTLGPAHTFISNVLVTARGRTERVDLAHVDWIETQGNYLALHGSGSVWLLRETSARLEAQLDPTRFRRIHRRTLVALDQVRGVTPIGAGDAIVDLKDGTRLRMSRSFRDHAGALLGHGATGDRAS